VDAVDPKSLLARFGLAPKKSFGQNFLADAQLARRIATVAAPRDGGSAIEIGAGLGALTAPLLGRTGHLIAIERDRDLVGPLRELFCDALGEGRLCLLEIDAKAAPFETLLRAAPRPHYLAGNLPYQITGPLLARFCELGGFERITALVQLEVAQRLNAEPATPAYGALSVFVQAAFEVRREMIVRRGAFYPQPRVDSAVVVLEPRATRIAEETPLFRELVKRAFTQRRKTLRNAWRGGALPPFDEIIAAARSAGVDLGRRGESLGVAEFARVMECLS
jgi:16S rRNA (adenine1518-N6/adenine1519-N6)-dimethyltransferase